MKEHIKTFVVAAVAFSFVDVGWITLFVLPLYQSQMREMLADQTNLLAAVGFYVVFLIGLIYFVIAPAMQDGTNLKKVLERAAMYGFATYGAYDLTAMAVLKNWPLVVTVTDILWGIFLASAVTFITLRTLRRT